MWFNSASEISEIAQKNGTSIFVLSPNTELKIPGAILLQPEDRAIITIEQVRKATASFGLKHTTDRFLVIRPADKLGLEASNALLKNLEEPGQNIHYILITDSPSKLLPTILSRAAIYFLKDDSNFNLQINASEAQKNQAKKLLSARPQDLIAVAEALAKKKSARTSALETLGLAIEMLYKSYFLTGKPVFIRKLPKYLTAYENISQNGHIKLQIVANLC